MKVSERIQQLRRTAGSTVTYRTGSGQLLDQLIQLEVEVVGMVQEARYEGYRAGLDYGLKFRIDEREIT